MLSMELCRAITSELAWACEMNPIYIHALKESSVAANEVSSLGSEKGEPLNFFKF